MADASGSDMLVQVLDGLKRLEAKVDAQGRRIDALSERLDRTNDTLMLLGSVLHQALGVTKDRIEDHERRIRALEQG